MADNPDLWAWFVFKSGLSPIRAKELLVAWERRGLTLSEALRQLPQAAAELGLTPDETHGLRRPDHLTSMRALTWHHELYPAGLRHLPLRLRPALLFYRGEVSLLSRPLVLLGPTQPTQQTPIDLLEETLDLILGEAWAIGAFDHTPQATLLLNALSHTEGEAVLFLRSGLEARQWCDKELTFLKTQRLVALSPLPPQTPEAPAWVPLLEHVAMAAASRIITAGSPEAITQFAQRCFDRPLLGLTEHIPANTKKAGSFAITDQPTDILIWLTDESVLTNRDLRETDTQPPMEQPKPELSPGEILAILESGGKIPSALRKRLTSHNQGE